MLAAFTLLYTCSFFVLSGYLMCSLLSRHASIGRAEVVDFYFRRLRRLAPIYLLVVAATLLACTRLASVVEYAQIADDAPPASLFYSNLPAVHETGYFDTVSDSLGAP